MRRSRVFSFVNTPRGGLPGTLAVTAVAAFAVVALTQSRAPTETAPQVGPGVWTIVRPSGFVGEGGFAQLVNPLS